jgi:hypothetical protein
MKPTEIINIPERYDSISSYSRDIQTLYSYKDNDCVIAYIKETLGTILLIRGAKKYFCFIVSNYRLHGNSTFRPDTKQLYNMFEGNPALIIVDKNSYENFKKLEVVKNL